MTHPYLPNVPSEIAAKFDDMMADICGIDCAEVEYEIRGDATFTVWTYGKADRSGSTYSFTDVKYAKKLRRELEYVMMDELCSFAGWDLVELTHHCRFVFQHPERYAVRMTNMHAAVEADLGLFDTLGYALRQTLNEQL